MVTIIFEAHGSTVDNEAGRASGHHDAKLSALGREQAEDLGHRYRDVDIAAVFCSDLQRSYATGEIAFAGRDIPVILDNRLRECDYGTFTSQDRAVVDKERPARINEPFPQGESYQECAEQIRSFLSRLLTHYDGKTIMIIGHRATQYGLEHVINGLPLHTAVTAPWQWRPGWTYQLARL
jgi:broad specificity phosphatase PhoE